MKHGYRNAQKQEKIINYKHEAWVQKCLETKDDLET